MRISGIALAAILLASCDSSAGDENEIRMSDDEGNESIVTSSTAAVVLPDGFSIYPGAAIESTTTMSGADGEGQLIIMTSSASPEDVLAHFREQAETAGYEIDMEMSTGKAHVIAGKRVDGEMFTVNASAAEGDTTAMLIIGKEGSN